MSKKQARTEGTDIDAMDRAVDILERLDKLRRNPVFNSPELNKELGTLIDDANDLYQHIGDKVFT
jgi:hypothetical protein